MPDNQPQSDNQELQAADWSHQLRQARQEPAEDDEADDDDDEDEDIGEDEPASAEASAGEVGRRQEAANANTLRQLVRQNRTQNLAAGAESKFKSSGLGSSRAARWAWETILETGGLSIIFAWLYLNLHVFLHLVLGEKMFCTLGKEWSLGDESGGAALVIGENSLLALADLVLVVALLLLFGGLFMIYYVIDNYSPTSLTAWQNLLHWINPLSAGK